MFWNIPTPRTELCGLSLALLPLPLRRMTLLLLIILRKLLIPLPPKDFLRKLQPRHRIPRHRLIVRNREYLRVQQNLLDTLAPRHPGRDLGASHALRALQHLLLDGAAKHERLDGDRFGLADAVRALDGLGLEGGLADGIDDQDDGGGVEVEALAAELDVDEEDADGGVLLECRLVGGLLGRRHAGREMAGLDVEDVEDVLDAAGRGHAVEEDEHFLGGAVRAEFVDEVAGFGGGGAQEGCVLDGAEVGL